MHATRLQKCYWWKINFLGEFGIARSQNALQHSFCHEISIHPELCLERDKREGGQVCIPMPMYPSVILACSQSLLALVKTLTWVCDGSKWSDKTLTPGLEHCLASRADDWHIPAPQSNPHNWKEKKIQGKWKNSYVDLTITRVEDINNINSSHP